MLAILLGLALAQDEPPVPDDASDESAPAEESAPALEAEPVDDPVPEPIEEPIDDFDDIPEVSVLGAGGEEELTEITVESHLEAEVPWENVLDRDGIESFPTSDAGGLIRSAPGIHIASHGAHGGAYQYFIRGFDAGYGSDLATYVEGIPINEPNHIHGHGYLDLHFLPVDLVTGVEVYRGSERAEVGDFGTAGTAKFHVGLNDPGVFFRLYAGTDATAGAVLGWRPKKKDPGTFLLGQAEGGEGVGNGRTWRAIRVAGGLSGDIGETHLRAFAFFYDGAYENPGLLRLDDYEEGLVDFWDSYDGSGDGFARRLLIGGVVTHPWEWGTISARTWVGLNQFSLTQNFTGYLQHPLEGDQVRQRQSSIDLGAKVEFRRLWRVLRNTTVFSAGADTRFYGVNQDESRISDNGSAFDTLLDGRLQGFETALWTKARFGIRDRAHITPGLRGAILGFGRKTDALNGEVFADPEKLFSWSWVVAPKLEGAWWITDEFGIFGAYGRGYRSPDSRWVTRKGWAPSIYADGAELGLRIRPISQLLIETVGFFTYVSNELVVDYTLGRLLPSGSTRRYGGELMLTLEPIPELRVEGELSYADARYVTDNSWIPYAPRWQGAVGFYLQQVLAGPLVIDGGIRGWILGNRPLPSGFWSKSAFDLGLNMRLRWRKVWIELRGENLLALKWREVESVYASSWDRSTTAQLLPERHFTAGDPFSLTLGVGARF